MNQKETNLDFAFIIHLIVANRGSNESMAMKLFWKIPASSFVNYAKFIL